MTENCLTAEIAGITFRFHCQGRRLSCARLELFEKSSGDTGDAVDIEVKLSDNGTDEADAELLFSAKMETTAENEEADWDLLSIPSTREQMIVQRSGARHNIKCASIRFTPRSATLTISPIRDTGAPVNPLVYPLFNIYLSRILAYRNGFLVHSSVVKDADGRGYLFTAKSGTGKSTMAHLFESEGATTVNDDMIAVRTPSAPDGKPTAYSIPMPYYTQQPLKAKLHGIFLISQSPVNRLARIGDAEATARLLSNVIQQPYDKTAASATLASVATCATSARCYALGFRPDTEVVRIIRESAHGE